LKSGKRIPKILFDHIPQFLLDCSREFESGSAAIERAAAERRGSRVLNLFTRICLNPTAETGGGVFVYPIAARQLRAERNEYCN
jgi:hypothetical protein